MKQTKVNRTNYPNAKEYSFKRKKIALIKKAVNFNVLTLERPLQKDEPVENLVCQSFIKGKKRITEMAISDETLKLLAILIAEYFNDKTINS